MHISTHLQLTSGSVGKASAPPSSRVDFFSALPACNDGAYSFRASQSDAMKAALASCASC